jgi:hypothetical protein
MFNNVMQMEIQTAEPLVLEPSETVMAKLRRHKLPGNGLLPTKLMQARFETLRFEIHQFLILLLTRKNFFSSGRSPLLYQFIRRVINCTVVIMKIYNCFQIHT